MHSAFSHNIFSAKQRFLLVYRDNVLISVLQMNKDKKIAVGITAVMIS